MASWSQWNWAGINSSAAGQQQPVPEPAEGGQESNPPPQPEEPPQAKRRRGNYGPRTCRICLETAQPKWPDHEATTFGISASSSRPTYISEDPELGRLLSPCKCKGSQKYVHEGCLNAWRVANPTGTRNYWQCPTCKFTYRMARLHWATMLSSTMAQIALTIVLALVCIFALGFIADPLLDLWFDPVGTIGDTVVGVVMDVEALNEPVYYEEPATWYEHFIKGFFSLGLVGIAKTMLVATPWQWWNLRGLVGTGRRQGTGRARVENMSIFFVVIGAFTFLGALWKAVRLLSRRVLRNFSDRVLDVDDGTGDDPDEGEGRGEPSEEDRKNQ